MPDPVKNVRGFSATGVLRCGRAAPLTVGRGPVPRHARPCQKRSRLLGYGHFACRSSRPPHRRARSCASPCPSLSKTSAASRLRAFFVAVERSRGTGPRATMQRRLFSSGSRRIGPRATVEQRFSFFCKTLTKNRISRKIKLIVNILAIFRKKMFDIYCIFRV